MSELYNWDEIETESIYQRLMELTKKYSQLYGWLEEWHDTLEDAENPAIPGDVCSYLRNRPAKDCQREQQIMDLAVELGDVPNDGVGVEKKKRKTNGRS